MQAPQTPGLRLTHWQAMCLFALLISVAFGFLSRKKPGERLRYAIYAFVMFLLIAAALGWLMYPLSH
ncbi:MAG TPA: hypothetical protein VFO34_14810 [Candidatus Acidoferrales bacterium]|nr:hypothetical protein [Candidatus Acidoferrales bacterium]